MKGFVISLFCSWIAYGCSAGRVFSQPVAEKTHAWVDVLKSDPRLKAPVNYQFKSRPSSEELFGIVEKASGVRLFVVTQGEKGKISFGSISAHNVPAWKIMEKLATNQVTDGKWEKTDNGYVLHGKPKEVGMAVLTPEREKEATAKNKVFEEAVAKSAKKWEEVSTKSPLRVDMRLRSKFTVEEKDPKLADLLERLDKNTGLRFTLDENLTHHEPRFGVMKFPDSAAWTFMEAIAHRDLDDGHWVKTDTGYRLEGTSRAFRLPPKSYTWAWIWVVSGLTAVSLTVIALVFYRRRSRKPLMTPTSG